jgi:hypothetical protein
MFDDSLFALEELAAKLRTYKLPVYYPTTHSIFTVYKDRNSHFVGLVRKKRNIPFYQVFAVEFKPSETDYTQMMQGNQLVEYVFANRDKVIEFNLADISGHDNFKNEAFKVIEETIK